ncbi:hypothetical protein D9M71_735310 [compost metagenome]
MQGNRGTAKQLGAWQALQGTQQRLLINAWPQVQQHNARLERTDGALQLRAGDGVLQHLDREAVAGEQPGAQPQAGAEGALAVFGQQYGGALQQLVVVVDPGAKLAA